MIAFQHTNRSAREHCRGNVRPNEVFCCVNGDVYWNLRQLRAGLEGITEEQACLYCQNSSSDVGRWARLVLSCDRLAEDLRQCATRLEALKCPRKRFNSLGCKDGPGALSQPMPWHLRASRKVPPACGPGCETVDGDTIGRRCIW